MGARLVWSVQPTDLSKRQISEGEGEARMEIFDRTFVAVGPSCGPELRNIRSCTGLQDCELSESDQARLPQLKAYEVLYADLNVEFA
jgi:hypothetical protein